MAVIAGCSHDEAPEKLEQRPPLTISGSSSTTRHDATDINADVAIDKGAAGRANPQWCLNRRGNFQKGENPLTTCLDTSDVQIQAAINEARRTVPTFMARLQSGKDSGAKFAFLIWFNERGKAANVWVSADRIVSGKLDGSVIETPPEWQFIKPGQRIRQVPDLVWDWRIIENGHVQGAYTTRGS